MLNIEISYTTEDDGFPEHYGYYDSVEDAKEALNEISDMIKEEK